MTKPKPKKEIKFLSLREASEKIGISTSLLRTYCNHGAFENAIKKRGTRWLISELDVERMIANKIDFSGIHAKKKKAKTKTKKKKK